MIRFVPYLARLSCLMLALLPLSCLPLHKSGFAPAYTNTIPDKMDELGLAPTRTDNIPEKADDFVASIGINVKNFDNPHLTSALAELGIRKVRVGIDRSHNLSAYPHLGYDWYHNHGIRLLLVHAPHNGWMPQQLIQRLEDTFPDPSPIYMIEGANEPDVEHCSFCYEGVCNDCDTKNFHATRNSHNDYYELLRNHPTYKHLPITTPTFVDRSTTPIKGVSPLTHDMRALHFYPNTWWFNDTRPTLRAHSDPTQQITLSEAITNTKDYTQSGLHKPVIITETGYNVQYPPVSHVDKRTQAVYWPRLLTEAWIRGVNETHLFMLLRGRGEPGPWGIVETNGKRYPAFYALKQMIELLEDSTWDKSSKQWIKKDFTPTPLNYSVEDAEPSTRHLLLQKSNGDHFILIWQDKNVFDTLGKNFKRVNNDDDKVTISFDSVSIDLVTQYRFDPQEDSFTLKESPIALEENNSIQVNVPDHVLFLKIESSY